MRFVFKITTVFVLTQIIVFTSLAQSSDLSKLDMVAVQVPEVAPQFPGGEKAMYKFLSDSLRYPMPLMEDSVSGIVYVEFLIDSTGKVKMPKILKGVHFIYDNEVIRVVSIMPDWIPAIMNGKPASNFYVIPIEFK